MPLPIAITDAAGGHRRGWRWVIGMAVLGLTIPALVVALRPDEYGLVSPARPPAVSDLLRLRVAQALYWLALPVNAAAAFGSVVQQLRQRRASLALSLACLSGVSILALWLWLNLTDFG